MKRDSAEISFSASLQCECYSVVRTVDVDRPYGPVVPIVRAKTLAVMREPYIDDVVLGAGEEEIALLIELDLRQ